MIRNLFATHSPRTPRRSSTRLRPAFMALEDRQLLTTFVVTSLYDYSIPRQLDLRQAIEKATVTPGSDTITFSSLFNTPQTIHVAPQLVVKHGFLTIDGPAAGLTIKGTYGHRILGVESNARVQISNVTITGGEAISENGGGVYNRGVLTLTNCTITDNSAKSTYKNMY
jgi:hypothetical protein